MIEALKRTLTELFDSKKAVGIAFAILTSLLTFVGMTIFSHLGSRLGLDPSLASFIPKGAAVLSLGVLALVAHWAHIQGGIDKIKAAADVAALAPTTGTPEFKQAIQDLAGEAIKAAIDQHLPAAIVAALAKPVAPAPEEKKP